MKYESMIPKLSSMKFTGLLFWVQENKLSERFYKKLGFEITSSHDQMSLVRLDSLEIKLMNIREDEEFARDMMSGSKGRGVYVYLNVGDIDKEYERQLSLGLKPYTEPRDWPWGNREFVIKDPDGYKLCFWQLSAGQNR